MDPLELPVLNQRQAICNACEHAPKRCAGKAVCGIDGIDLIEHAEQGYCPIGKYKLGMGDRIASALYRTRIAPLYKRVRKLVTKKPCGCPKRQKRWNRWFPTKKAARAADRSGRLPA